jgi:hypothetical protein
MKRLQPENLGLPARPNAGVQEINAFKTLENPAHLGAVVVIGLNDRTKILG